MRRAFSEPRCAAAEKGSKVVYIGGFAKTPRYQGGGSSHINTIRVDSALEMAESHGRRVSYVEGFPADLDQRRRKSSCARFLPQRKLTRR